MKRFYSFMLILALVLVFSGCQQNGNGNTVVATTKPVYDFTSFLCQDTDIHVTQLVTENLSCLHDYTLHVKQMRAIESADAIVISGAGLEDFLQEALQGNASVIDASQGIKLLCGDDKHDHDDHDGHHHENDTHIWLDINNARTMAQNISIQLQAMYPHAANQIEANMQMLIEKFDELDAYGKNQLANLSCRDLITFHDGFAYFAAYWDLHIVHSLEEESGSEASAAELKELISLVNSYRLPAIFTEENGSTSASYVVANETSIPVYALSMCMSDADYFTSMRYNIDTIKEALE